MYVGAVSEGAKEYNLGHEQSNVSEHLCQVGRNGQQLTAYHSSITRKKE